MPRVFASCVVCNKQGEGEASPDGSPLQGSPPGWVSLLAVYWPPGVTLDPLVLRVCATCYLAALTGANCSTVMQFPSGSLAQEPTDSTAPTADASP